LLIEEARVTGSGSGDASGSGGRTTTGTSCVAFKSGIPNSQSSTTYMVAGVGTLNFDGGAMAGSW